MTTHPPSPDEREPTSDAPSDSSSLIHQLKDLLGDGSVQDANRRSASSELSSLVDALEKLQASSTTAGDKSNGDARPVGAHPGTTADLLDRFELRESLGEGGFAVVVKARDRLAERDVAIKIPKLSALNNHSLMARFSREPRLLAALDHPHIVPVLETGWIENIPYFVMALGEKNLRQWTSQRMDAVPPLLAVGLIRDLADAVDHAHRRGLLHRDIKPANVLLFPTEQSTDPDFPYAAKLADFGLATEVDDEESFSVEGSLIGTWDYMSPEQAGRRSSEVSVQSDLYSLGVVLFELLTNHRPFAELNDPDRLKLIPDMPAPSPRKVCPDLPADLDAICQRCLEPKPSDRYASAAELREDFDRFLRSEPVRARPVGVTTRFARWCRRRPLVATLVAALLVATVSGVAGITWQWTMTRDLLHREQIALAKAMDAIDNYTRAVTEDDLLKENGFQPLRRQLLADALRYYQSLVKEQRSHRANLRDLADALHRLGVINEESGEAKEAEAAFIESAGLRRTLIEDRGGENHDRVKLAKSLRRLGRLQRSGRDLAQALQSLHEAKSVLQRDNIEDDLTAMAEMAAVNLDIGTLHRETGDFPNAQESFNRATTLGERLTTISPHDLEIANELARAYGVLVAHLLTVGKVAEARKSVIRAIEISESIVRQRPDSPQYAIELVSNYLRAGELDRDTGRPVQAAASFTKACSLAQQLVDRHPNITACKFILGQARHIFGNALLAGKLLSMSDIQLKQALSIRESLAREQPEFLDHKGDLAATCHSLGELAVLQSNLKAASDYLDRAIATRRQLLESNPRREQWKNGLARSYAALAHVEKLNRNLKSATELLNSAITLHAELQRDNASANLYRSHLGSDYFQLGLLLFEQGKIDAADESFQQAERWQASLVDENPQIVSYEEAHKKTRLHRATLRLLLGGW